MRWSGGWRRWRRGFTRASMPSETGSRSCGRTKPGDGSRWSGGWLAGRHRESPRGRLTCWVWAARGPEKTPAATRPAEADVPKRLYPELVTKGAGSRRRGGLRRGVAAHRGMAQAVEDPLRRGQGTGVAGGRGARPELEVAMLERHGLTLPPETMPLTGLWRSSQLNWRRETLREVRRAVAWRRLARRILTLNLWRQ